MLSSISHSLTAPLSFGDDLLYFMPMPRKLWLPFLLLLISSIYLYTATTRAIFDDGDALYAHAAQQMIERQDWVTPYANGVRFLDKPPMMYWLMAAAYVLIGVSEFAARLPSVLAVLGTAFLLYFMGKKAAGHHSGFIAGIALAFCTGTFLFTRMVFPDILFVFLLTLALFWFLRWYGGQNNPVLPALAFYACMAAAVLTKGLIGLFFPLAIILLFFLQARDWNRLKGFHWTKGTLLFLALAVPWHFLAAGRNSGFLWYFFVNEHFLRFLGRRQPLDYESLSIPAFWLLILVWFFPWSPFLPAIWHSLSCSRFGASSLRALLQLSVSWIIVVLSFFSLSSRIEHYSLPVLPPLALLLGIALSSGVRPDLLRDQSRQIFANRGFALLGILGGIVAVVTVAGALVWLAGWKPDATIGPSEHPQAYKHYFAPLFGLAPQIASNLKAPLLGTVLIASLGLVTAWWVNRRGWRIQAILVLSGMMMGFCIFVFQSLGVCEEVLSSRQFGRTLNRLYRPGDRVIALGDYETVNSVNFYSPATIDIYDGTAAVLSWGMKYPDSPMRLLSREDFESCWKGPERVFLLIPDTHLAEIPSQAYHLVLQSGGRTLVSNRPNL